MTIGLVDYGLGNLGSVVNMLKRIGAQTLRVSNPDDLLACDRIILPGVGAFDTGVRMLHSGGLGEAVQQFASTGKPVLGICLGMQLLLDSSAEGTSPGLGLIEGSSVRFSSEGDLRVPHMGWNRVSPLLEDPLVAGIDEMSRFYFVHSYKVVPARAEDVLATTNYGGDFASMIRSGNVMGAQYHPEKSHTFGMRVLSNFATS